MHVAYIHGNTEQTEKLVKSILKLDSKNRDALLIQFNLKMKDGKLEEGADIGEKIPDLDPKILSSVYTDCAGEFLVKGDTGKAKKYLRKALAVHKENIEALTFLGDCELKDEKYKDAIASYFQAIDKNPAYTSSIIGKIENAFYQSNSFDELSTRLREELSEKIDNPEMHFALGKFLKKRRLLSEARDEYKRALEFNPTHLEAREEILGMLFEEKNFDRLKSELRDLFNEIRKNTYYFCNKCSHRDKILRWKCTNCGEFDSYEKRVFLF